MQPLEKAVAVLTIRNMDAPTKTALRVRAAQRGVSMEEEARRILRDALSHGGDASPMGQRLRQRFAAVADAGFALPARQAPRAPLTLG